MSRLRFPSERLQNSELGTRSAVAARAFRDRRVVEEQQSAIYSNQYSTWRARCGDSVNRDAKRYVDVLNATTQFVECAICGIEESLGKVIAKGSVLSNPLLNEFFVDLSSKRRLLAAVPGLFGVAVDEEFDDHGMLRRSLHVCLKCKKRIDKHGSSSQTHLDDDALDSDNDADGPTYTKKGPKVFALMHGLYCGPVPMELKCLNFVELTLVSQINVITRVNVHAKYVHSTMKSFSVLNAVHDVVKQLPNIKVLDSLAYVRSSNTANSSLYAYRPFCVLRALHWLVENNPFYADVEIIVNAAWNNKTEEEYINDGLHEDVVDIDTSSALNEVMANEVVVEINEDIHIGEEEFVMPEQTPDAADDIMTRNKSPSCKRFNDMDWAYKAFPKLFPFGRGFSHQIPVREYVGYTLQLGGDRRFQASSPWIFKPNAPFI